MKKDFSLAISMLLVGIMILSTPSVFFVEGKSGGTSGTEMFAQAAGGFEWNEIHGFVIEESSQKVDEEFNVTISEKVKYDAKKDKEVPSGQTFGELHGIHWDDSPEPVIAISNEDFNTFKQDENNLTVYVYGEYYNEDMSGQEERYAYTQINITKPNNSPVPMAWVAEEGNWTWFNLSEENDVTFIDEDGGGITLWFNASHSWDPDMDDVVDFKWDFDGDGIFGEAGEKGENISKPFTAGVSHDMGLIVGDARGKDSDHPLDFTIRVRSPATLPDLEMGEVKYENKNKNKQNYEVGDTIVVQPKVTNIGENDTHDAFKVRLEYSKDSGPYNLLEEKEITTNIEPQNFVILTYEWNTQGYPKGKYILKAIADPEGVIEEEYEDNNENTTNLIQLEQKPTEKKPILSIESVKAEKTKIYVTDEINVTVTIKNDGEGIGTYVDVNYEINNVYQFFKTIDEVPALGNFSVDFTFSGDTPGPFILKFTAEDDGDPVGDPVSITITVEKHGDTNGNGNGNGHTSDGDDDGGFLPGFELVLLIGAVAVATIIGLKKRSR